MALLEFESGRAMAKGHPRYYRERGNSAFWEPGPRAEAFDLPRSKALGAAGPEAMAAAHVWNTRLDAAREAETLPANAPGTFGSWFVNFRKKEPWRLMDERTKEDYWRAWRAIEPRFAAVFVDEITPEMSERFHVEIHPAHEDEERDPAKAKKLSWNEAHRTLKVWRALLTALVDYRVIASPPPIGGIANPAPPGREGLWLHEEVMGMATAAAFCGHYGLAAALLLAWDAMLAPVDVRTLPLSGWQSPPGAQVSHRRAKTGKRILHAVSEETAAVVELYLAHLRDDKGLTLRADAPLIRRPDGTAYRSKDTFGDDFRAIRGWVFPGDQRQLLDIRRSASTEARAGGADRRDIGRAMANTLGENDALADTYLLEASQRVLEARKAGRERMAARFRLRAG